MTRAMSVSEVPKRGLIGVREVETVFGCSWQTCKRRIAKGLMPELPKPMHKRGNMEYAVNTPLCWPAEEIWQVYRKWRKGGKR